MNRLSLPLVQCYYLIRDLEVWSSCAFPRLQQCARLDLRRVFAYWEYKPNALAVCTVMQFPIKQLKPVLGQINIRIYSAINR